MIPCNLGRPILSKSQPIIATSWAKATIWPCETMTFLSNLWLVNIICQILGNSQNSQNHLPVVHTSTQVSIDVVTMRFHVVSSVPWVAEGSHYAPVCDLVSVASWLACLLRDCSAWAATAPSLPSGGWSLQGQGGHTHLLRTYPQNTAIECDIEPF